MALINKNNINRIDRKGNKIHSEVTGSYSVFVNDDGKQFLQIDTYGSPDRKIQAKVSQSLQFDRETGEFLLNLLRNNESLAINKISKIDKIDEFQDLGNIKNEIKRIENYMKSKSFLYSNAALSNFYLSLKTKPFIILAGTSGTGKSKLVRLFAEAIGATKENERFNMISVKPDWNDSTELLGYKNINEEFVPGNLTKIIYEASMAENKDKPYFICLDEMNLARVEYYLSDYLSLIESREASDSGEIITDKLFSMDYLGEDNDYSNLCIPENVYIVGTVNMDDTTFAFSRKVLDRANTIEFSDVDLDTLDFGDEECKSINVNNSFLRTSFLNIKDALNSDDEYVRAINSKVKLSFRG